MGSSKAKKEKGPSDDKYKTLKKKLKEENEYLAKKLLKTKSKLMVVERERDILAAKYHDDGDSSSGSSDSSSSDNDSSGSGSGSGSDSENEQIDNNHSLNGSSLLPSSLFDMKPIKSRRPVAGAVRRIQRYPQDETTGAPLLPIQVGVLVIHEIGTIVSDRHLFHSDRYIFPVGFKSTRQFMSMVDPDKTVTYESTIVDGGDGPKFIVTPEDCPERAAIGNSATGAWTIVIKAAYQIRNREHTSSASGPDFFGLSQGVVCKLIQDLPGARECRNYTWQEFEYISGRGAKRLLQPGEEPPPSKRRKRPSQQQQQQQFGSLTASPSMGVAHNSHANQLSYHSSSPSGGNGMGDMLTGTGEDGGEDHGGFELSREGSSVGEGGAGGEQSRDLSSSSSSEGDDSGSGSDSSNE